jgi:DNA-binding GntR family transcriptional regulator
MTAECTTYTTNANNVYVNSYMARPLRDQATELLGQEIAAGKLPPGSWLNERDIADRFCVSGTPAREVLLQLSSAGLVRIEPRQGAVVLNLSPQEIVSMVEILVALEGEAVSLATRRMEAQQRREIAETYRLATDGVERMSSGLLGGQPSFPPSDLLWQP